MVFIGFIDTLLSCDHWLVFSATSCIFPGLPQWQTSCSVVSSIYLTIRHVHGISPMIKGKSTTPNTLPWGTPPWMCSQLDTCCPIFTRWCLSVRKAAIQATINSGRWYIVLSLVISMVWSMWLNALLKSKSRILTYCCSLQSSVTLLQWWYSSTRAWALELPLLQPYWIGATSTLTLSQIHFTMKNYRSEIYWVQIFFQPLVEGVSL